MHYRDTLLIKPERHLLLKDIDPAGKGRHESEHVAKDEIGQCCLELTKLQSLLYAEKRRSANFRGM